MLVLQNNVQCVNDSGDVAQDSKENVDQQVSTAASLEEDAQGRQNDGNENLANV